MPVELRFADFAGSRPFHAALVHLTPGPRPRDHTHVDFHELLLVTEGSGTHWVTGQAHPLRSGDLVLVRPTDAHAFTTDAGLEFVNVAFPSPEWRAFTELAGIDGPEGIDGDGDGVPPCVPAGRALADRFAATLRAWSGDPRALDVLALWAEVAPLLADRPRDDGRPAWLTAACTAMLAEEHLRAGLPRLRELAAVSDGHLARSTAAYLGCTPVAFVAAARLDHAATLLATTTLPVGRIAERCGFGSQSYFTRVFHERFGRPPRAHRDQASRAVVPPGTRAGTAR